MVKMTNKIKKEFSGHKLEFTKKEGDCYNCFFIDQITEGRFSFCNRYDIKIYKDRLKHFICNKFINKHEVEKYLIDENLKIEAPVILGLKHRNKSERYWRIGFILISAIVSFCTFLAGLLLR